ncbi:MAG: DEAD/DEAH box helicase [Pseudomonadota bacterium]
MSEAFEALAPKVQRWVYDQGWQTLRPVQEQAIPPIMAGGDIIVAAPTAGGKTEAAFLPCISRLLLRESHGSGIRGMYVGPIKALINDQFGRLEFMCRDLDIPIFKWHGDVGQAHKNKARSSSNSIVLITPESIEAQFVRRGHEVRGLFGSLDFVVIDELHALIGSDRGVQLASLLSRIERLAKRKIDRIGLSATLGDMRLAAAALRPEAPEQVKIVEADSKSTIQPSMRGYVQKTHLQDEGEGLSAEEKKALRLRAQSVVRAQIAGDVLSELDDYERQADREAPRLLVFPRSRSEVEELTNAMREACEKAGRDPAFFAHHGNLSKSHREWVEERLKAGLHGTCVMATSTLELGIDIGLVKAVTQVGAPLSVAALRQRVGRSGRRDGEPAILNMATVEGELSPDLGLMESLRANTIQMIAMFQLMTARWCEPPVVKEASLSVLVQQVLSVLAERGAIRAADLFHELCGPGPFQSVSKEHFAEILRAMGREETALVMQSRDDGSLLLGATGEKLASSVQIYTVFETRKEYRVLHEAKELGRIPINYPVAKGDNVIWQGRPWHIDEIDEDSLSLRVKPAKAGTAPRFGGGIGGMHRRVAEAMRDVWLSERGPTFLDGPAQQLLSEGRARFRDMMLDRTSIVEVGASETALFPWIGWNGLATLSIALKQSGVENTVQGVAIVAKSSPDHIQATLDVLEAKDDIEPSSIAVDMTPYRRAKYDFALTDGLLIEAIATDIVDLDEARLGAERLLSA